MNRFDGKIALLTGAASGVGKATSIRLASEGARIYGLDLNADGMAETRATIEDAGGTMATRVTDISNVAECRAAVDDCVAEFGAIDIVGNIAGIANQRHVHQVTEAEWDLMNGVNLKGMFFLTQAALPHVLDREGNIINIASNAGLMGQAYTVPYCATKGGVVNMTKALAMEFVKQPIRINAIAPGGIDTPLVHNFEIQADVDFALMQPYMGFRDASTAEQIAALFAHVASDEAGNIHGSIISADGGLTASQGRMIETFILGVGLDGVSAEPPPEDLGYRDLEPVEGAAEALWRLSDAGVWIRVITQRLHMNWGHQSAVVDTVEWLDRAHIPYRDLCFLGNKPQVEADLYVDESSDTMAALRKAGNEVIVFDRPHNQVDRGPRAATWAEVEEIVMERFTERQGVHGVQPQLPGVDGTLGRRLGTD